jgi:hypothetical protein
MDSGEQEVIGGMRDDHRPDRYAAKPIQAGNAVLRFG